MAKTYEELLEQAAIIRDETAAGKNTATRVGGTITDAVDYVKNLQDTYEGIHAEAAAAKTTAEQAKQSATNAFNNARSALLTAAAAQSKAEKNADAIAALQGNVAGPGGDSSNYGEQIKELEAFDTYAALLEKAAKFYIVSDNAIALLHGTYKKADGIYNSVLILQQVEKNSDGSGTAMQYIYNQNRQFTRSITFSATNVTSVQPPQNDGARNLSLSERVLQMTNMCGENVGDSVTLPDKGNIREGTAGPSSVPVVLAKTFGGTATATLGAATSERAGVMTIDHVNRISKLENRVLQYLYQKIYQLNEGAGARVFNGFTEDEGVGSLINPKETYRYSVLYSTTQKQFVLNVTDEASGAGVRVGTFTLWPKISLPNNKSIASSESYAERDKLYYIFVSEEGSTYYYIDSNGDATERSATYLLRRLVNKNASDIAAAQTKNADQDVEIEDLGAKIRELGATIHDNGNLYEGTAGPSSVPVVLAKTFGGTATATLGAATSARAGVMTVSHVNRISKLEERLLQYLYPKIYQLNEGAGARQFHGFTEVEGSGTIETTQENYQYSVLYSTTQKQFVLNVTDEASGVGVRVGTFTLWPKISLPNNKSIASSESYAQRDRLYYIFEPNEGSTYYYIDSKGEATEQSATYLLRRLIDKNADAIAKLKTTAENAQNKLSEYADTFPQNPVASSESNGLMSAADKAKFETVDWQELLAYGISFNTKDADPDCTRIGNPSLHRTLPIQSKMRGGTLLPGGEFTPFENVDDWTSEVRDGSAGDVMVEIPEHYIKFVSKGTIEKGQSREIWLSEYPLPGFQLVPKVYVSAYECAMYHPVGVSTSDYRIRSVVNLTADYRGGDGNQSYDEDATASRLGTACPANKYFSLKVNPMEGFSFYDYAVHTSIYWLMCVEYGTRNIHKDFIECRDVNGYMQGGLGTTAIYTQVVKVGVSDTYGNRSGVVSTTSVGGATVKVPRYRGIEFPFGNYGKELKGLAFANAGGGSTKLYVTADRRAAVGTDEADGTHNEFGNQEEWIQIGKITSSKQVQAYISDILFGDSGDIIPISIEGGGSGKYYCEQTVFYNPTTVGNLTSSCVYNYGSLDIRINASGYLSNNSSCRRIIYYPKKNKS